jgi:hypothetical protein
MWAQLIRARLKAGQDEALVFIGCPHAVSIARPPGNMNGMVKQKVTITLDRSKAENARSLMGAHSTSEVVDMALDHLIRAERLRRDIAAYKRVPPTAAEGEIAAFAGSVPLDDTDWEGLYSDEG